MNIRIAVFDALCACLDLDRTSPEAAALIREACAEPENTPRLPRNRNVVYWTLQQDADARVRPPELDSLPAGAGRNTPVVYTTLNYRLQIVCYGPACEEYALRIRHLLFLDGAGFPRKILRDAGVFPVPDPPQPLLLYEEEGSLRRARADLSVPLRVRAEFPAAARGAVASAPAVVISRSK